MDVHYGWDTLHGAVLGLARSTASVQERLTGAYLALQTLRPDADLPGALQPAYASIEARLTAGEPDGDGEEGSVRASTRAMSEEDARRLIEEIVALYDRMTRHLLARR